MFTDVKNLQNNQVFDRSPKLSLNRKTKGRFHKLFKPLLRMLRTAKITSNYGAEAIAHPNNVNLNNCTDLSFIAPTMFEALTQAAISASYEDYAVVIRKVAKDEDFLQSYFAEDPFGDTSLDCTSVKTNPQPACECSHGFNCQQYHGEYEKYKDNCETSVSELNFVPVHYVRTDNGTFFWTTDQIKLDEDLMESMGCSSNRQPAQAQWDNGALLY